MSTAFQCEEHFRTSPQKQQNAESHEERIIGKKSKRTGTDPMVYFDEFARIHFLNNARKKAKTQAREAKKLYKECCSAMGKEKETMVSFFKAINSDDDLTSDKE